MIKNNPYIILLRQYRRYVPSKRKAIVFMLMQFTSRAISLLWPYLFGKSLVIVQEGWENMIHNLLPYAIATLILPFMEWAFHGPARVREENLAFDTAKKYREDLYHKTIALPMVWHTNNHSGETIDRINKAVSALKSFGSNISQNLGTFISFIWALIALILLWPILSVGMFVLFICMIFVINRFDKKIVAWIKEENTLAHKVSWLLFDYLSNIRTLITLRFLSPTEMSLSKAMQEQKEPFKKHILRNEQKWFVTDSWLEFITAAIIIAYVLIQWQSKGVVMIGVLTMISGYTGRLANTFYNLTWSYSELLTFSANISAIESIEAEHNLYTKNIKDYRSVSAKDFVNIDNLFFSYDDQHGNGALENNESNQDSWAKTLQKPALILSDISLQWNVGDKIALIGESGSGKSTFLSLMRGLYDVNSVRVSIDGRIFDTLQVLSDKTSLVPQEPEIFEETMLFNIAMWTDVSQETIEKYAKIALFHDIALSLPNEYQTSIKEKWVNLSWGQKQRLALARGLLAAEKSEILLLDESTSSVDSINEKKIYTNIFQAFHEKTIIAAIHKLHLLPLFDHIYVFEAWRIVEHGSFDVLIANDNVFRKMRREYTVSMESEIEQN